MLIDTHAHLYHKRFDSDRHEMIQRAFDAGVEKIVMPAIDVASIHAAIELSQKYDGLYVMSALHPSDTREATDADFQKVVDLCDEDSVVAVGESGLDYYWDRTFDDIQHDFFRRHIQLAIETDLPLVIHNRDADSDVVRILTEERDASARPERLRGIFHCYGGPLSLGKSALELGFHLGVGGTVTFKNGGVAAALDGINLKHVVLETDAPFLAPEPNRGKRNESAYVRYVAERLATIYELSYDEIARQTSATARKLFKI